MAVVDDRSAGNLLRGIKAVSEESSSLWIKETDFVDRDMIADRLFLLDFFRTYKLVYILVLLRSVNGSCTRDEQSHSTFARFVHFRSYTINYAHHLLVLNCI